MRDRYGDFHCTWCGTTLPPPYTGARTGCCSKVCRQELDRDEGRRYRDNLKRTLREKFQQLVDA